jgi:hypothetical protein
MLLGFASSNILSAQNTWQSNLVKMDSITGELTYTPEPISGIRIPDFSRAGYKGGGVDLPAVEVKLTIDPIGGDNTDHIQKAIDSVSSLPIDSDGFRGALFLNPGVYRVYGSLDIRNSGVVLRGAGRESDSLSNTHILGLGNTPEDRSIIRMGGMSNTSFSGMVSGTKTNITSSLVRVGDKKFQVADVSPFQEGDNIIIYHPCTQKWLDAINGGGTASDAPWTVGSQPILYNTRIVKIQCDTIYTNSPVFNNLDNSLSQSYIYKYNRAGLVENIGLENLRVDIEYNPSDPNDDNHARRAVLLTQVENAWIKGCEFLHFWFAGVDIQTANYVTVQDCNAYAPKGPTTGGYKYNFCVSRAVQNSLFTNCRATEGRHAFVSNGTSSVAGVVFHKCTSIDPFTSSEGHRRWTTGLLYDNFIDTGNNPGRVLGLYNRGRYGTGHGWSSANSVAWNCDARRSGTDGQILIQRPPTAQNFSIGSKGVVNGSGPFLHPAGYIERSNTLDSLVPNSLYEAQLNMRIISDSIKRNINTDVQCACDSYTWLDGITYYSSTNSPEFTLVDMNGGDSIVTLNLAIYEVETTGIQENDMLVANAVGATYQWLDCDNDFANISGETDRTYTPLRLGNYAVEVIQNGCIDTSACISFAKVGIEEHELESNLMVFPNPTTGNITIDLGAIYPSIKARILDLNGQLVGSRKFTNSRTIDLSIEGTSAYYLVELLVPGQEKVVVKVLKE